MTTFALVATLVCFAIPIYVYVGYPLLLLILNKIISTKEVDMNDIEPSVSLLISCYNEAAVMQSKIENSLAIDYPKEKLEIIFVSDGSDDGTDEIVKQYEQQGIRLVRQEGRLGKTCGLNLAVPTCTGEVIVFSDANAIYQPDAIRKLVRNFNDASVGYVVGAALYGNTEGNSAATSENSYWQYEMFIKTLESNLHSVVGGDGAIYAIRHHLYEALEPEDINDFVNPLQIIAKGFRGIFEPEAICTEETAASFEKEGLRKQRIVNRSFRGLMRVSAVMNPFKSGFFSLQIISHKLLRWLIALFVALATVGSIYLSAQNIFLFQLVVIGMSIFYSLALIGFICSHREKTHPIIYIPYYFILVNFYSLKGIVRSLLGKQQVTWNNTRSSTAEFKSTGYVATIIVSSALILILILRVVKDLSA